MEDQKYSVSLELNKENEEHIKIIQMNISGGKAEIGEIDIINKYPNAKEITISGLIQETFDYFLEKYGNQFKTINFWKCPLVFNLKKIEELKDIEEITYFWNQRATELWDLSKNKKLIKLELDDFTRVHNLNQIGLSENLEEFHFGDKIWTKCIIESIKPISKCKTLKKLSIYPKKIEDNDITPLLELINLREIKFLRNFLTTEEAAWLKANLSEKIKSETLMPYKRVEIAIESGNIKKDTFITGKRKPVLNWENDQKKIKKYEKDFYDLVEKYKNDKNLKP